MISQPLIQRTEEELKHLTRPIFIHLMKEDLLRQGVFTLDGQTFNGKDYIIANLLGPLGPNQKVKFKFDGATVVYRIDPKGESMTIAICFKSHEDDYNKKIGRRIAMEYIENLGIFSESFSLAYDNYKGRHAISFSFQGKHLVQEQASQLGIDPHTITLHDTKFRDVAMFVENMAITLIHELARGSSRIVGPAKVRSSVVIDMI